MRTFDSRYKNGLFFHKIFGKVVRKSSKWRTEK